MSSIKTRKLIATLISFINLVNKTHPNNSKRGILKTFKGVTLVTLVTLITLEVENKTLTVDDVTTFTYTTVQQTIFELSAKS